MMEHHSQTSQELLQRLSERNSSELFVITSHGNWTLTKAKSMDDYTLWCFGTVNAQGSYRLMSQLFEERKDTMAKAPATPAPVTNPVIPNVPDVNTMVGMYVKLRDAIKAQDEAHKEKMHPYREKLEQINNMMLDYLQKNASESVKTENGTVYRSSRKSASLEDADAFMRHVIGAEDWDLLDRKANATAVEEYVKTNGVLPPGVKYVVQHTVGVRRA